MYQNNIASKSSKSLKEFDHIEFRYYSGLQNLKVLAKSTTLKLIINDDFNKVNYLPSIQLNSQMETKFITFKLGDLKAAQLRKGVFFNPDPYLKITIIPDFNFYSNSGISSNEILSKKSVNINCNMVNINNSNRTFYLSGYERDFKTHVATNTCFPHWKNEVIF